ncbi:hypothetical protein ABZ172_03130 [Streptomyces sp. NPDC006296]|uniref:hypothetical protein n=1 Tax=Streptomyces sp. NPDC006296 TaxID=3156746 RepID=UPI0033A719FE
MGSSRQVSNRITLGVLGLLLLSGGALLGATQSSVADRLPAGWLGALPGTVLVDHDRLSDLRGSSWWTPTVIAAGVVLTLVCARWCVSRCGRGVRWHRVRLPLPGGFLHLRALGDALTRRTGSLEGVERCRVRIRAKGDRLHVRTHVWIHPDTSPAAVLPALSAVLDEARGSLLPHVVTGGTRISTTHRRSARIH